VINRLKRHKKTLFLCLLLFCIFLAINSIFIWKMMYPIDYTSQVRQAAEKYELDPYLILAVIRVESNFDPSQKSSVGAAGLMQVMPDTAEWILEQNHEPKEKLDRLHSPEINIDMGAWFLYALNKEYKGNWVTTLAAYNAGPGNVKRWIKDGWDPSLETIEEIPFGETRHYVQRVLYYWEKYKWIYEGEFTSSTGK
jgi:soluble lytic murein transglycosylase